MKLKFSVLIVFLFYINYGNSAVYIGFWNSIIQTNTTEYGLSDYTLTTTGTNEMAAGGALSNSYAGTGNSAFVSFPAGFDISTVSGFTINISGTIYYPLYTLNIVSRQLFFSLPADLQRNEGFQVAISDVTNPPLNAGCGTPNYYYSSSPCNNYISVGIINSSGGVPNNYNLYAHNTPMFQIDPAPYFINSLEVEKPTNVPVFTGANDEEVLLITVDVAGSTGGLPILQEILISSGVTSQLSDIINVRVWSTGAKKSFHSLNDLLITSSNSYTASTNLVSNFILTKGVNHLWVTFDLDCQDSSIGNLITADFNSIQIDGVIYTDASPIGSREIVLDPATTFLNIVQNGDFEIISNCPTNLAQFDLVQNGWNNPGTNGAASGSSDLFSGCSSFPLAQVPLNYWGTQDAKSGNNYAGVLTKTFSGSEFREYLQYQLPQSLIAGAEYQLVFYVSGGDSETGINSKKVNGMGAYFSSTQYGQATTSLFNVTPHIIVNDIILDEVDWFPVYGKYIATGSEQFLIIGNFLSDVVLQNYGPTGAEGYYFVEDVILTLTSEVPPCVPTILSVELIEMNAVQISRDVLIDWVVSSEFNIVSYILQKSYDGLNFEDLAEINRFGQNTSETVRYEYSDHQIIPGIVYYKLLEKNVDGNLLEISVQAVNVENNSLLLYPNPCQNYLKIRDSYEGEIFRILDVVGNVLLKGIVISGEINVTALEAGAYLLQFNNDSSLIRFTKE